MNSKPSNTVYALYDDCNRIVCGVYASKEKAEDAFNKFLELDDCEEYVIEECSLDELTPEGQDALEWAEEHAKRVAEWEAKENDEEYLVAHPQMRHPWTDVAEIHVAEGELVMDFASPTNARIYKEFARVWATNVDRLADRLGITKSRAAHDAGLFGYPFSAMSYECDARDCGYDVAKFLKGLHCFWNTRTMVEEDAMRLMRIAHTVHLADKMYEQSLQIKKWAESYGLQPSEMLV